MVPPKGSSNKLINGKKNGLIHSHFKSVIKSGSVTEVIDAVSTLLETKYPLLLLFHIIKNSIFVLPNFSHSDSCPNFQLKRKCANIVLRLSELSMRELNNLFLNFFSQKGSLYLMPVSIKVYQISQKHLTQLGKYYTVLIEVFNVTEVL